MQKTKTTINIKKIIFILLIIPFNGISQKTKSSKPLQANDISKWTKAVVNLECQSNFFGSSLFVQWQRDDRANPGIHKKDAVRVQDSLKRIRHSGTAIYFFHKNKYYLITARHVLEDTSAYMQPEIYDLIFLRPNGSYLFDGKIVELDTNYARYIRTTARQKLNQVPFIFSIKEFDLAILSLSDIPVYGQQFIYTLKNKGYVPITANDIDTLGVLSKKDDLLAIGFPSFSEVQHKKLSMEYLNWQSYAVTVPVITKGIVEDPLNDSSSFFTGNIFIYHGFSGGPVIKNNQLLGVSRSYALDIYKSNGTSLNYYLFEKSVFTKTKFIMPMLRALETRLSRN